MKKLLIGSVALLVLAAISIYVFIPNKLVVSKVISVNCSIDGAYRYLSNDIYWADSEAQKEQDTLQKFGYCDEHDFIISHKKYNSLEIAAGRNDERTKQLTKMIFLELERDSILIQWQTPYAAGLNPLKRVLQYRQAVSMKKCMIEVLNKVKYNLEKVENVYGYDIRYTTLKDSVLVSTKETYRSYPTIEQIYSMIEKLKNYIHTQGAKETNYPMLNIIRNADSSYLTMVAIATNRELPGNKDILLKRLLQIPNKTLTTEVKGGPAKVEEGLSAIETFMRDFRLSAPVYPFQLLITDRSHVKDSTKWITKLFYPIT